jgi:hypothetical protein
MTVSLYYGSLPHLSQHVDPSVMSAICGVSVMVNFVHHDYRTIKMRSNLQSWLLHPMKTMIIKCEQ